MLRVDDRLVVDGEGAVTDRGPEVLFEAHAFDGGGVHGRFEHAIAALSLSFRLVHGGVGVGEEPVGLGVGVGR